MKISELRNLEVKYYCKPIGSDNGYSWSKALLGQCFNFDALNEKLDEDEENFAFFLGRDMIFIPDSLLDLTTRENFITGLSINPSLFELKSRCDHCCNNGDCNDEEKRKCLEDDIENVEFMTREMADFSHKSFKTEFLENAAKTEYEDYIIYSSFTKVPVKSSIKKSPYVKYEDFLYRLNGMSQVYENSDAEQKIYYFNTEYTKDKLFYFDGTEYHRLYKLENYEYKEKFKEEIKMMEEIPISNRRLVAYGMMIADPKKYSHFYYYSLVNGWE